MRDELSPLPEHSAFTARTAGVWVIAHAIIVAALLMVTLTPTSVAPRTAVWQPDIVLVYSGLAGVQAIFLQRYSSIDGRWWISMSIIGALLAGFIDPAITRFVDGTVLSYLQPTVSWPVAALVVGLLQWLVLRRRVRFASLWVGATIVCGYVLGVRSLLVYILWFGGIGWLFPGALVGLTTAPILLLLLNDAPRTATHGLGWGRMARRSSLIDRALLILARRHSLQFGHLLPTT